MSENMEPGSRGPDWWKLAGVGALAVILSLVGFRVASRFESPALLTAPAGEGATALPTTTTTVGSTTTLAPPPSSTSTSTASGEDLVVSVSEEILDFGDEDEIRELQIVLTEGGTVTWSAIAAHESVSLAPAEGELTTGLAVSVTVTLDRSLIEEGEFETTLTIGWGDSEVQVLVEAVKADNPIIHNPQASPSSVHVGGGECSPTRTTISARVRDTSELDRVIARWSPDGSTIRETAMSPVGEDIYEGVIGPFESARVAAVKVVGFDVHGNAGGASISVTVEDCG